MPIYEYKCNHCGYRFEELQKVADEPLRICPKCHRPNLVKLVSVAGFQLKGTGWYATDFKDKPKPKGKDVSKAKKSESSKNESGD